MSEGNEKSIPLTDLIDWFKNESELFLVRQKLLQRLLEHSEAADNPDVTRFAGNIRGRHQTLQSFAAFLIAETTDLDAELRNLLQD